jgi:DNA-binding LacI/PurR family transcriptional regulator
VLGRLPDVTAVFVASDEMAFGVIRALRETGKRVPEDVSVVGMDDIALAAYCDPPLTTIRQPFEELGRAAVDHVVTMLADPEAPREQVLIEATLIERASAVPHP